MALCLAEFFLLQEIQLPGGKRMDTCDYLKGHEITETCLQWHEEKNGKQ